MKVSLEGQKLRQCQGDARCHQAFHRCIVGQVEKECRSGEQAGRGETLLEKCRCIVRNTESSEDDCERLTLTRNAGLQGDLGSELVVGQARAGEDGQLLAPHQRVHAVDGRNARLDKILRVGPYRRIQRSTVNVHSRLGQRRRQAVFGTPQTVEDTP